MDRKWGGGGRRRAGFGMAEAFMCLLMACPGPVPADENTILGPSGYISIPSADVLERRTFSLGMWMESDLFATVSAECGIGKGLEVGAGEEIPRYGQTHVSLNFKWALLTEDYTVPGFSWGMRDRWNFLVLTKTFEVLGSVSVSGGAGTGDFEKGRVFAGIKWAFYRDWYAAFEHDGYNANAGIRIPYVGLLGASAHGISSMGSGRLLWGYTYQFDLKKEWDAAK